MCHRGYRIQREIRGCARGGIRRRVSSILVERGVVERSETARVTGGGAAAAAAAAVRWSGGERRRAEASEGEGQTVGTKS